MGTQADKRAERAALKALTDVAAAQERQQAQAQAAVGVLEAQALKAQEALEEAQAAVAALRERRDALRSAVKQARAFAGMPKQAGATSGSGRGPRVPKGTETLPIPQEHAGDAKVEAAYRKGYASKGDSAATCPMVAPARIAAWQAGRNAGMEADALATANARA